MNLRILFEDTHIIVCYKPSGIATQTSRIGSPDMVSLLKNYLHKKNEPYLAVIHRLDQPVEGILVFAKTPFAAKELNRQMQANGFGKFYKAVLCGKPEKPEGTLENYMVKDGRTNTSRVCSKEETGAKRAVLSYRICDEITVDGENYPVAEIRLQTGRHHQIRVQMAHMGCPLLGDVKYNPKESSVRQIALCAYRLEFIHPKTKKRMQFEITPAYF